MYTITHLAGQLNYRLLVTIILSAVLCSLLPQTSFAANEKETREKIQLLTQQVESLQSDLAQKRAEGETSEVYSEASVTSSSKDELMSNRIGFAKDTQGGHGGVEYIVTSLDDSGLGSLREALESAEAYWITFSVEGEIELLKPIRAKSNKTVDGRDVEIVLKGYGIQIYDATDVIVASIAIVDGAPDSTDAIEIVRSNEVWIDHVTLANFGDGLIDIKYAPGREMNVTVSNSLFDEHNKVSLVGLHKPEAPDDSNISVTYANNYFTASTAQRHPRVAQAYAHLVNNVIEWNQYGVASYDKARVYSEGNWYVAPEGNNKTAIDYTHGGTVGEYLIPDGYVKSVNDVFENGSTIATNKKQRVSKPRYKYQTLEMNDANKAIIIAQAGSGYGYTLPAQSDQSPETEPLLPEVELMARNANAGGAYSTEDLSYTTASQIRIEWSSKNALTCTTMNLTTGKIISRELFRTEANITEPEPGLSVIIQTQCESVDGTVVSDALVVSYSTQTEGEVLGVATADSRYQLITALSQLKGVLGEIKNIL